MKKFRPMYAKFITYLEANSIEYECKSEDLITFSTNQLHFMFAYEQDDKHYFRILLPRIYKTTPQRGVSGIINDVNTRFKVAKTYILDGEVWAVAEQLVYSQDNIDMLFGRTISILTHLYNEFKQKIQNNEKQIVTQTEAN